MWYFSYFKRLRQGPIVTFNLKKASGEFVGYGDFERLAELNNILVRTGCMCNPGACQAFIGLSDDELIANFKVGFSIVYVDSYLGGPCLLDE